MKKNTASLNDTLVQVVAATPEKVLYRFLDYSEKDKIKETAVTYKAFARNVHKIAAYLQQLQATGERALLLYPPSLDYIVSYFGCLHAGIIAVPVYVPMSTGQLGQLKYIADNCQARYILTVSSILDIIKTLDDFEPLFGHLQLIATDSIPDDASAGYREMDIKRDTLAFLQYTSGSTSRPKGVMVTHGNLLHNISLIVKYFQVDETIRVISWLPPFHDMGLIGGILTPLYLNACATLMSPLDFLQRPFRWLEAISKFKGTVSGGPNFAYDLCAKKVTPAQIESLDLSTWALGFNGAEAIRPATLDTFTRTFAPCGFKKEVFYPCYGMAEATLMISGGNPKHLPITATCDSNQLSSGIAAPPQDESASTTLMGCGTNLDSQEIRIVSPDTLETCPEDRIGEIWVSGPSVAQGYWNQPEDYISETFQAKTAEGLGPYLRTGDLGFLKNDVLFVTGRLKDIIIIMGRNLYPHDLEFTITDVHPACRPGCSAAFGVDIDGNEKVVVVQEIHKAHADDLDLVRLTNTIKTQISEKHGISLHKLVLVNHGSIPKTSSGKIRRNACKTAFLSGELSMLKVADDTPSAEKINLANELPVNEVRTPSDDTRSTIQASSIQEWLVDQFAQKMEIMPAEIDIHAPLRQFAPSSLDSMHIAGELEQWLGKRVSPTSVYNYPTIALLAEALAGDRPTKPTVRDNKDLSEDLNLGTRDRDIAIIGMGCRFPGGAKTPENFWELLNGGVNAVQKLPADRRPSDGNANDAEGDRLRNGITYGGYIDDVDKFDATFFSMLPREAEAADPQQRLLLETSWHALEDAGIIPSQLAGSRTSVFVGISSSDYAHLYCKKLVSNLYSGIGNALSIAANRISYFYNFRGPSLSIDTACSSSLVAVHQACSSLLSGESELALAGGVNLILDQDISLLLARGGMLALDGKCKSFDKAANGYVRGEGCGVVVLKRLSDALRDGNDIIAVIAGSAVNQDGRSNGITAPNGPAQEELITQALKQAGITPDKIGYVEAHGTGTSLGDPIEVNTLIKTLTPGRTREQTCFVGSVKTNIGHLEAAAGIAGLIKTALCLKHNQIVPNLHLKEVNPRIAVGDAPMTFPVKSAVFPTSEEAAYAGVSSFGFGGSNAHVILKAWQSESQNKMDSPQPLPPATHRPVLITLSAHNEERLQYVAASLRELILSAIPNAPGEADAVNLNDLAYSLQYSREAMPERVAFVVADTGELIKRITDFCEGVEPLENTFRGNAKRDRKHIELVTSGDSGQNHLKAILANQELDKLAHFWACGFNPDWGFLYRDTQPRRITLPAYPFERQRHWVASEAKSHQKSGKHIVKLSAPMLVPLRKYP